jgi:hypothetical protein
MSFLETVQDHFLQIIDTDIDTDKPETLMKIYVDTLARVFPGAVLEESRNGHLITYKLQLRDDITEEELQNKHRSLKAQLGTRLILTEWEGNTVWVYTRGIPAVSAVT